MTDPRDLQIHIHEHVGPLRERVGKIEGKMEVHDRELTMLRQGLDGLRDRIDGVKGAMLGALEAHTTDEIGSWPCSSAQVRCSRSWSSWSARGC